MMRQQPDTRILPMVLLATAMFSSMGGPALAPALPAIHEAYAQMPDIEYWTKMLVAVSGFFAAIGAPLFGWLSDRRGRRPALLTALIMWGVFGASGMLPQPFWTLLAGRALLGLSLGGLLAANTAMIADSFDRDRQRHMMGLQSTFSASGVVLALVFSGFMAELHWRMSFSIFLAAFAVLPFAWACPEPASLDAEEREKQTGLHVSTGLALLFLFGFMIMMAFNIVPTQLPFFMKKQSIHASSHIGLLLAVLPVSAAVTGRMYARISRNIGLWNLFVFSGSAMLAGLFVLSGATGRSEIIAGLILLGIGFGTATPHVNVVLARLTAPALRGRVMGILTCCKFLGLAASPILLQPVLAHAGYRVMFRFAGGLMLGAAVVVWLAGRIAGRRSNGTDPETSEPVI